MYNPAVYQYFDIALTNFSDRKIRTAVYHLWQEIYPVFKNVEITYKKCVKEIHIITQLKIDEIRTQYHLQTTKKLIKQIHQTKAKMIQYISLFKSNKPLALKELSFKKGFVNSKHNCQYAWTDGSYLGENQGTIGYILKNNHSEVIIKSTDSVEVQDSVEAELLAIKIVLYKAMYYGIKEIVMFCDSESAILQLKHSKNPKYKRIIRQTQHLFGYFSYIEIIKIDRIYNKEADSLT